MAIFPVFIDKKDEQPSVPLRYIGAGQFFVVRFGSAESGSMRVQHNLGGAPNSVELLGHDHTPLFGTPTYSVFDYNSIDLYLSSEEAEACSGVRIS